MREEIFLKVVMTLISLMGVIVTYYLIPWLKTRIEDYKLKQLFSFIEYSVRWAEQEFTPEENKKKKGMVYNKAREYLKRIGLELTDEQLDTIVEGIVNEVKKQKLLAVSTN